MDAQAGIAWNVVALRRIVVSLVAMAAGNGALPRHLHRAVLRLLRPAESATRRLIIAMAATPQMREKETIALAAQARESIPASLQKAGARRRRQFMPRMPLQPAVRPALSRLALPLLDPPTYPFRRARVAQAAVPRLWIVGSTQPRPALALPAAPGDLLDATRLRLRLAAVSRALDDLPGQALRFARWQARRAAFEAGQSHVAAGAQDRIGVAVGAQDRMRFRWPLRPGRPPGSSLAGGAVQSVLAQAHALGWWALEQRADTS
ncbi:hypothetical protein ASD44_00880 [Mesorhizobium sp. Root554]|uniref:hypothetical protein n=1 Tax=unclassified Mesorhizobium TaxID=325217 RepID=UPI0006FFF254|nr:MULTISPECIES: hypothetical protein [unclassified Mesorhizobium]KQZ12776.1 hypothetical protein ASD27_00880 [Mesorhizobium sp. Root1471]KQZ35298.1 hypothetical protein ASD44_00880 [Mesorhizobium sp. Root554]